MNISKYTSCIVFCMLIYSSFVLSLPVEDRVKAKEASNVFEKKLESAAKKVRVTDDTTASKKIVKKKTANEIYQEQLEKKLESKRKIANKFNVSLDTLLLLDAKAQKEYAWSGFYKKPKKCENFSSDLEMIKCSNFFARKKKQFEKAWKSI